MFKPIKCWVCGYEDSKWYGEYNYSEEYLKFKEGGLC